MGASYNVVIPANPLWSLS